MAEVVQGARGKVALRNKPGLLGVVEAQLFLLPDQILEEPTQEETALHDRIQPTVVYPPDCRLPAPSEAPTGDEVSRGPGGTRGP